MNFHLLLVSVIGGQQSKGFSWCRSQKLASQGMNKKEWDKRANKISKTVLYLKFAQNSLARPVLFQVIITREDHSSSSYNLIVSKLTAGLHDLQKHLPGLERNNIWHLFWTKRSFLDRLVIRELRQWQICWIGNPSWNSYILWFRKEGVKLLKCLKNFYVGRAEQISRCISELHGNLHLPYVN